MRIMAINPGSTSTKIAVFDDERKLFEKSVSHDEQTIKMSVADQLPGRLAFIERAVADAGFELSDMDAFVGRGGGCVSCVSGVYAVNDTLLSDARAGKGALHPACLGSQIADAFANRYGAKAFIVNPPDTDELDMIARMTGLKDVYRRSHLHALNQKEVGMRYAASAGKNYDEINLIIAHMGGGISITAHRMGRMIDSSSNIKGEGPMAPTRAGTVPAVPLIELCFSGKYDKQTMIDRIQRGGGWTDHLGTADLLEVRRRISAGDSYAKLIYDVTVRQIAKSIGSYAAVLCGEVDAILLSGGLARDGRMVDDIIMHVRFIAPVHVYPGEFELEALAAGALRALSGEEIVKEYTGVSVWEPGAGQYQ